LKTFYKKDYPYMYARVSAKKAKLYTEKDYNRFLKMEVNEISRKMEEGDYSKEINQLGSEFNGADLIEKALNQNLRNTFEHLLEISSEDAKPIIEAYTRRFTLMEYKKILRWKKTDEELTEEIKKSAGKIGLELEKIKKGRDELVEEISFEDPLIDYQAELEECNKEDIQICLDKAYSKEMRKVAANTRSKEFQKYVKNEQFYQDLVLILRMKKYGVDEDKINRKMVSDSLDQPNEVIEAQDFETALNKTEEIIEVSGDTLEEVEHSIKHRRLQEALSTLHKEPLGLSSVIGYMVAKTIEVENLRMMARAKETGIQNTETIKSNLVLH